MKKYKIKEIKSKGDTCVFVYKQFKLFGLFPIWLKQMADWNQAGEDYDFKTVQAAKTYIDLELGPTYVLEFFYP